MLPLGTAISAFSRQVHLALSVVSGNSRRRQQLALVRRTITVREAVVFSAQLVAEIALERTVVQQQAELAAQRIELANAKAALAVLKEQQAQIMWRRKAVGQPPMQVLHSDIPISMTWLLLLLPLICKSCLHC